MELQAFSANSSYLTSTNTAYSFTQVSGSGTTMMAYIFSNQIISSVTDDKNQTWSVAPNGIGPFGCYYVIGTVAGVSKLFINSATASKSMIIFSERNDITALDQALSTNSVSQSSTTWFTNTSNNTSQINTIAYAFVGSGAGTGLFTGAAGSGWSTSSGINLINGQANNLGDGDCMFVEYKILNSVQQIQGTGTTTGGLPIPNLLYVWKYNPPIGSRFVPAFLGAF